MRVYQHGRHVSRPLKCEPCCIEGHSIWWVPMDRTLVSSVGAGWGVGRRLTGGCEDMTTWAAFWRMSGSELLSCKHILQSRAINHSDSSYAAFLLRTVPVAPFISPIITLIMLYCNYLCSCLSHHQPPSSVLTGPASVSVLAEFSASSTGPGTRWSINVLQEERISCIGLHIDIISNCWRNNNNTWLKYG